MEEEIEIKLTGPGLNYTSKISFFKATQIMAFIAKPSEAQSDIAGSEVLQPTQAPVKVISQSQAYESPRQTIDAFGAKTNPQKIVAIAYYLGATSQNGKTFKVEDVLNEFAKAGERTPKNITRDFKEAVAAGYVYAESKNGFRLLSVTDNIPIDGFKKVKTKRRAATKIDKKTEKKTELAVRSDVKSIPITTILEGYPELFDIKLKSDQLLWIIKYAQNGGVNSLNRLEIFHFTNKMGAQINSKNFTATNIPNVKKGYISYEGELISLTPKGEKHLKGELNDNKNTK